MSIAIGLIGGASGKELTEYIQKFGFTVALVIGKADEPGSDIADHILVTDLRNIEQVYSWLKELGVKKLIIGTGHRFAFKLGEELERKGIQLNVNIQASELAKEKRLFKDFITERGFSSPAYISVSNKESIPNLKRIVNHVGLPCVVKATIDTMLPQKINNENELFEGINMILESGSPVLIEQFIKGIDITVFVSASKNEVKALPICYYSKAEDNEMKGFGHEEYLKGHLLPEIEKKVMEYCEKLVITCGFEGLPRVDLMVMPNGEIYILETNSVAVTGINERHAAYCKGTVLALRMQGIDVAEVVVKTALKKFGLLQ